MTSTTDDAASADAESRELIIAFRTRLGGFVAIERDARDQVSSRCSACGNDSGPWDASYLESLREQGQDHANRCTALGAAYVDYAPVALQHAEQAANLLRAARQQPGVAGGTRQVLLAEAQVLASLAAAYGALASGRH